MKKLFAWLLVFCLILTVSSVSFAEAAEAEGEDEENYETGDASLDDPRNADQIGEKELLVVSFGTSYNDSRRLTIGGIENTSTASLKEPKMLVTRTESAIVVKEVSSRFFVISPIPFRRFAVLK